MQTYGPLCALFYDLDKPHAPPDAADFYLARAKSAGGPVLEPMCGSGRFLLPLLRAGVDVDGVDASQAMLDACSFHAASLGLRPSLYRQCVEALELPRSYRMSFIPSGSIGLLENDEAVLLALSHICRHLAPGGRLFVELLAPDGEDPPGEIEHAPRVVTVDGGSRLVYRCRSVAANDGSSTRFHGKYELCTGSAVVAEEAEVITLRHLRTEKLLGILSGAGFRESRILDPSGLPWLRNGGLILLEAWTDA